MSNLVDIVQDIISLIDLNLQVKSITDMSGVYRVEVCKTTLHLTLCSRVQDDLGNIYEVTGISNNEYVDLTPVGHANAFTGNIIVTNPITYLHGSPSSVNNEYLQIDQLTRNKVPFIWLLETYTYTPQGQESSLEAEYSARLFFMAEELEKSWSNDDHNNLAIKPMENLANAFIEAVNGNFAFKTLTDYTIQVRPRFGVEVVNRGSREKIIEEFLTGIELNVNLELYSTNICNC
jgi:hypothetical protein